MMQTSLNLVWLAVTLAAPWVWRFRWAVSRQNPHHSIRVEAMAIICFIVLMFPVISLTDDLHPEIVTAAPLGGTLALLATGTNFSVSSGVGFLAVSRVSVRTGVIMLEYINQLRARGRPIEDSAVEGAVLRLRPMIMTMLVFTFGLLPPVSHAIGSDSQRPFAIVIVGGLIADLMMNIFVLPTLYVWFARDGDKLPEPGESLEV